MGDTPPRRMRSVSVAIGVTAVVAAALTGCTSNEDYDAVCIDEDTQERVSDDYCDDDYPSSGSTYVWYYVNSSRRVPSVGSRVSGGSTVRPADYTQKNGQSSSSGSRSGSSSDSSTGSGSSGAGSSSTDYGGFGGSSGGVSS